MSGCDDILPSPFGLLFGDFLDTKSEVQWLHAFKRIIWLEEMCIEQKPIDLCE